MLCNSFDQPFRLSKEKEICQMIELQSHFSDDSEQAEAKVQL